MPWAGSEGSEAQPRKYNGKEWVEAFGYDNYLYGARDYYSAIGRFTVVDPFAEKYAHISPYTYCANNPIKYVDPDGREIINKVDPNATDVQQQVLYEAAERLRDQDDRIFFVAHGSPQYIYPFDTDGLNASQFVQYLKEQSVSWKENRLPFTIVLISCYTGQGENPIAAQVSSMLPGVTIIAPTEEVKVASDGVTFQMMGVFQHNVETIYQIRASLREQQNVGRWNVFQNGKLVDSSDNELMIFIYEYNQQNEK